MSTEPVNKQGQKVKFIRVRGRVVPVKADKYSPAGGAAKASKRAGLKKPKKAGGYEGDFAYRSEKVKTSYENKAKRAGFASALGGAASLVAAHALSKSGRGGAATLAAMAGIGLVAKSYMQTKRARKASAGSEKAAIAREGKAYRKETQTVAKKKKGSSV